MCWGSENGRWTEAHKLVWWKSGSQATTEYALNLWSSTRTEDTVKSKNETVMQ